MSWTSLQAYDYIRQNGLLSHMRLRVYEDLLTNGPSTAAEVTARLLTPTMGNPSFHRRLSELEELGIVYRVKVRECRLTGHLAEVWEIVPGALPQGTVRAKASPSKAVLRSALEEIADLVDFREKNSDAYEVSQSLIDVVEWIDRRSRTKKGE